MAKLHKFLALSPAERGLLLATYGLLNGVRLGLWRVPYLKLQRYLERISHPQPSQEDLSITHIIWAVNTASRYSPGKPKCLARALTTQVWLCRQGYISELKFGVMKNPQGQMEAHAWVEHKGQVVIGQLSNLQNFKPLPAFKA